MADGLVRALRLGTTLRGGGGQGPLLARGPLGAVVVVAAAGIVARWALADAGDLTVLALGVAMFVLVFVRAEFALHGLLLSMLLSPEIGLDSQALAESRALTVRGDDILLAMMALSWLARTAVNKELGLIAKTRLNRPILAYLLTGLLATLLGYVSGTVATPAGFLYVLKYAEYFVVYYLVANNVADGRQAWRLVTTAFLTAAVISVVGLAQLPGGGRVSAPFEGEEGEPNTFGGYLLLMMALAAGLAIEGGRGIRLAGLGLLTVMLPPFLFTLSRSSYLGVVPVLGVLAVGTRRRLLLAGLLVVVVLALLAGPELAAWLVPSTVVDRIAGTFRPEYGQVTVRLGDVAFDPSTSERLVAAHQALGGWLERPLFGWGITGFAFVDGQYARTLVETGLLGMLSFLWLVIALMRSTLHAVRSVEDSKARGLGLGFLAGTAGLLTQAIGVNTFIIIRIMEPFWFFAAVVQILPTLETAERDGDR